MLLSEGILTTNSLAMDRAPHLAGFITRLRLTRRSGARGTLVAALASLTCALASLSWLGGAVSAATPEPEAAAPNLAQPSAAPSAEVAEAVPFL